MNVSYLQDARDILIHPVAGFERFRSYSLSRSYRQYVLLLICYTFLSGIVQVLSGLYQIDTSTDQFSSIPLLGSLLQSWSDTFRYFIMDVNLLVIYGIFLLSLFTVFLIGFILHTFVILFEGGQGVTLSLRTVMHAATPFFLIGWIPYIGLLGIIWMIILCIAGIRTMHEISWWKAMAMVFIPLILVLTGIVAVFLCVMNVIGSFTLPL